MNLETDVRQLRIPPNIAKAIYARVVKNSPSKKLDGLFFIRSLEDAGKVDYTKRSLEDAFFEYLGGSNGL